MVIGTTEINQSIAVGLCAYALHAADTDVVCANDVGVYDLAI